MPRASWKPCAIRTASCPVIPSATRRISWGLTASLRRRSSAIISSSICSRPAVSTMTVRARAFAAASMPRRAIARHRSDGRTVGRSAVRARLAYTPTLHLLPQRHQLVHRGGAVDVRRHQERRLLLELEPPRQLARRGRLARALQPDQQDDRGRHRREGDRRLLLAEHRHQLVIDDLDELLARPDGLEDILADGLGLHPLEELAGQVEADVGLEENPPDFPEPLADVVLGEDTLAGEPAEGVGQLGRQVLEHKPFKIDDLAPELKRRPEGAGKGGKGRYCSAPWTGTRTHLAA